MIKKENIRIRGENNIGIQVKETTKVAVKGNTKIKKVPPKKRATSTKTPGQKKTTKRGVKTVSKSKQIEAKPPVKKKSSVRSQRPKRNHLKRKKFYWSDTEYVLFYISLIGYIMFIGEVLIYWFLTKELQSFFELFFVSLIREPYVPIIIGGMFLLPLHTYLLGMNYPFKKSTLVGFFFIVRNIAYLTFLWMV